MDGNDVGARLRRTRKEKNLSLEQLSHSTKISVTLLQALESNQIEKLPGDVFTRGFLRAYAHEVGLNPEEIVDSYFAQFEPVGEPSTDRDEHVRHGAAAPPPVSLSALRFNAPSMTFVGVALIVIFVGYFGIRGAQSRDEQEPAPAATQTAEPNDATRASSSGEPPPPAMPAAAQTMPTQTPPLAPGAVIRFDLTFNAPCWISATADGKSVVARLMQPGERQTIEAQNDLVLRVGDPGALAFAIDGAPGRSLGAPGQPVTIHITRQNIREFIAS